MALLGDGVIFRLYANTYLTYGNTYLTYANTTVTGSVSNINKFLTRPNFSFGRKL